MPRRAAPPPSPTMSTRSNRSATSTGSSALPPVTAPSGRTTRAKRTSGRRGGGDGMYTEEEDGVEELDEGGGKGDSPVSRLGSEPSRPRAHVEVQINRPSDRPVYGSTSVNEANALTSAHRKFLSQSQAPGPENGNSNGSHMNGHTGYARSGTTPIPADMSHTSHASSSRRLGTPALIPAPPMETVTARRSPVPEVQTFATTYQLQQRQNGLLSPPLSAHGHSSSFGSTMNGFGHAANGEQRGSVSPRLSSGGRPQGVGRVIAPVAYHMTVNPDDSAQADTSGMGNQTAETSGYSYSAEEEHVRRVMEQQRRQAEAEAEEAAVNARRTGKGSTSRTHRPRLSEDGGGPVKRGSAAQAQHDKARYRPHDDSQTDGDEDDEGGAGIASGGGHLRRSNRGKRAEAQGGPSNNTAGLRQRSTKVGQDRGGETDEGIGGSEEDDRSQERMREKSRSPFPPVHIQAPTPARAPIMQPAPTKRRRQAPAGRAAFTILLGGFPALLKQIYNLLLDVAYMFASIFRKNRDERIINTSQSSRTDRSGVPGWMKWLAGAAISYAAWQYLVNGTGKQAPHGNGKGGYVAPHVPPGTLEELVERLTGIESVVSAIGSANAVLKDGQRGADDRLRRLETTVPDVERRMIAQSARLDRAELEHSKAWKAANSITDKLTEKLGAMERDLHGLPEGVRALVEKQGKSESALEALQVRLDGVEKELKDVMADGRIGEALQRVLPTYVPFKYGRAGMEIDPTFWVELRKVLVGKDKLGEVVRRTLRQEVDAGYIFAGAGSGKDAKKDAKELDRIREMEREATKAREADWDRLEQWKANLLDKLSDQEGRSPSIRKEHFASLFEENALGLRSAIDDLRALVTSTSSDRSSSKSSATGQSVTYQLSTSEDITTSLTSLIDAALLRYSKDTLARPDYALYSAGARVVAQITTPTLVLHRPGVISRTLWGKREIEALSPAHALMPGNVPGQCWSFKGQEGQLGVMLKERVVVGDLSMEHAPRETVGDVRAAPREVEVWGLVEDQEDLEKVEAYYQRNPLPEDATMPPSPDYLLLSTFTYDVDAPNYIQTFPVPRAITDMGIKMGVVIWKFKSNWGAEDYTCLYRVRVHEALSEA